MQTSGNDTQTTYTDSKLIDRMLELYGEERSRFYKAMNGAVFLMKDKGKKIPMYLTRGHISQHLMGKYAVCVIGSPNGSRFTCFDVDHGGWEMAVKVMRELENLGIDRDRIYVSTSGGKGYHVELFYDRVIDYRRQKGLYDQLIWNLRTSRRDVELRPTHTQSIKIPLSVHHKTGNVCWYLDRETGDPILSKEYVYEIKELNADHLESTVLDFLLNEEEETEYDHLMTRDNVLVPFEAADLNYLPRIEEPGSRHDLTMRIAMTLRMAGRTKVSARSTIIAWYDRQDKNCTLTERDEAIEDICRITDWVFARYKFAGQNKTGYRLNRADIERVLEMSGINRRAILFHVLVWERSTANADVTTQDVLAHIIGTTERGITYTWNKLRTENVISITVSKAKRDKFGYYRSKSRLKSAPIPALLKIPDSMVLQESVLVDPIQLNKDFWRVYFDTLFTIADRDWVITKLSKRERDKLAEIEDKEPSTGTEERKEENGTQD